MLFLLAENDLIGEGLNNAEVNEITMDKLKSLVELRPQVIDDFSAIFEKFPHTNIVSELLYSLVSEIVVEILLQPYSVMEFNILF